MDDPMGDDRLPSTAIATGMRNSRGIANRNTGLVKFGVRASCVHAVPGNTARLCGAQCNRIIALRAARCDIEFQESVSEQAQVW